jgi:hypothetical protein
MSRTPTVSIIKAKIPVSNFSRTPTVRMKKGRHQ